MRPVRSLILYMALMLTANAASAADIASLEAMREGDMKKLAFHVEPRPTSEAAFQLADGAGTGSLADYRGKVVLLNFWATWCAPCRKEMPALQQLQTELGGDDFQVVTLATGRNSPEGIVKFFDEIGVTDLPRHQDPKQAVAREMGVMGLPVSVLIDRDGREIARLIGDADWASDNARAIISGMMAVPAAN
ncbi:TlpA disulfide reductase family protein [Seohaeicola zhoushanensis]|uniref:Thioredoxin n=1 Tax=Seohaeicola zhoushanensis TaxID=1569283 RepID=A0A8J3GTU8_9RHOB|nr:TlpA disulfide reductase family protein [Seohaeicola zhoushanensis]GHF33015.1 thioredoxin [Seohaeicola zhoushanensis]